MTRAVAPSTIEARRGVIGLVLLGLVACGRKDTPSGADASPTASFAAPNASATLAPSATQPPIQTAAPSGAFSFVARLTAPKGALDDRFGAALALEGNILAVGAPLRDEPSLDAGAVYVFERGARGCRFLQILRSPRPKARFGERMVMMDGKLLVSRAFPPEDDPPRWFVRRGEELVAAGTLDWPTASKNRRSYASHFGHALAVHGDRLLVAARGSYVVPGRAFLFRSAAGGVEPEFHFDPESSPDYQIENFYMGDTVALDDRHVALLAPQDPRSSVVVFRKEGSGWRHQQTFPHAPGEVALSGSFLLVASADARVPVSVYREDEGRWTRVEDVGKAVGVAAEGDVVALSNGALYRPNGARLVEVQRVTHEDGRKFSGTGPVVLRGGVLAIGEPDEGGKGAVYVYEAAK
jgi:hypothetical protein